jgi:hypothetical protein
VCVGTLDIAIDFLDQFPDAAKRSTTNGLLGDAIGPDLHLVQPRSIGGSVVHVKSRPCCEPAFDSRMFVRSLVIHNDVYIQGLGHVRLDLSQEPQVLLMPVALSALRNDFALRRVQHSKQCRGPVAQVIVGHSFDVA